MNTPIPFVAVARLFQPVCLSVLFLVLLAMPVRAQCPPGEEWVPPTTEVVPGASVVVPETTIWVEEQVITIPAHEIWVEEQTIVIPATEVWIEEQTITIPGEWVWNEELQDYEWSPERTETIEGHWEPVPERTETIPAHPETVPERTETIPGYPQIVPEHEVWVPEHTRDVPGYCRPETMVWTAFTEVSDEPTSDWTPSTDEKPTGEEFLQSRSVYRTHRSGERNSLGEERNVTVENGSMEVVQLATGTGIWSGFSEVIAVQEVAPWSPHSDTIATGTEFDQTRTVNRTRRIGERHTDGTERNVSTATEEGIAETRTIPGTGIWSGFSEVTAVQEVAPWAPHSDTIATGTEFDQTRTVNRTRRVGERHTDGRERNVSTATDEGVPETRRILGTGIWTAFDDTISVDGTGEWTPSTDSKPAPEPVNQSRPATRVSRVGERHTDGRERNVAQQTDSGFIERRTVPGTGVDTTTPPTDTRIAQTLTFQAIPNFKTTDGGGGIMLAGFASSSSGLPVRFSVVSGPVHVSENQVAWFLGAGHVTIRADQAGNSIYKPAPSVQQSFTLTQAAITPNVASQLDRSTWRDINGDDLLDEVIYPGTTRFKFSVALVPTTFSFYINANAFWTPFNNLGSFGFSDPGISPDGQQSSPVNFTFDWEPEVIVEGSDPRFNLSFDFAGETGNDYSLYAVKTHSIEQVNQWAPLLKTVNGISINEPEVFSFSNNERRTIEINGQDLNDFHDNIYFIVRLGKAPVSPNWTLTGIANDSDPIRYYMADAARFVSLLPSWDWHTLLRRGDWNSDTVADAMSLEFAMEAAAIRAIPFPVPRPALPLPVPLPFPNEGPTIEEQTTIGVLVASLLEKMTIRMDFSYVVYQKLHKVIPGKVYVGRTWGPGDPTVRLWRRDASHERNVDHHAATINAFIWTQGISKNHGYFAMRGREQQAIDFFGGLVSNGGNATNLIRGVSQINPNGYSYWLTSNLAFGQIATFSGLPILEFGIAYPPDTIIIRKLP